MKMNFIRNFLILFVLFFSFLSQTYAQPAVNSFYEEADIFFPQYVFNGGVDYRSISQNKKELNLLIKKIETYTPANDEDEKAFLINAYNLIVIKILVDNYPVRSPQAISGFFKYYEFQVSGAKRSLDDIENNLLRKKYADPRLHFVLVCGAKGCPPLISSAYLPNTLNDQLDKQCHLAVNKNSFVNYDIAANKLVLSEIFKWYESDFKKVGGIENFINNYRTEKITSQAIKKSYSNYDWSINELTQQMKQAIIAESEKIALQNKTNLLDSTLAKDNEPVDSDIKNVEAPVKSQILPPRQEEESKVLQFFSRADSLANKENLQVYTPSKLYRAGQLEYKVFANLYSQKKVFDSDKNKVRTNNRGNYLTLINQVLIGINPRVNVGFDLWIKSVFIDDSISSPFKTFTLNHGSNISRTALSSIGPKIKIVPFKKLERLSVQATLLFPVAKDQEGILNERPFLSRDSYTLITQIFYDFMIVPKLQVFVQASPWLYIKRKPKRQPGVGRFSASNPLDLFISYFPTKNLTFFIQEQFWPDYDDKGLTSWFRQEGLGFKYQVLNGELEFETSVTKFTQGRDAGAGITINFGIRYVY